MESKDGQPKPSTQYKLSRFETATTKRSRKEDENVARKRTPAGRGRATRESLENGSSEGDTDEDRSTALELRRLMESEGEAELLWAEMEEFAGMTRAAQTARRSQRLAEKNT